MVPTPPQPICPGPELNRNASVKSLTPDPAMTAARFWSCAMLMSIYGVNTGWQPFANARQLDCDRHDAG